MIKPLTKGSEVSSKEKTNELLNTVLCFVIFLCCNYGLFFTIVMSSHAKRQIGTETSDSAFLLLELLLLWPRINYILTKKYV